MNKNIANILTIFISAATGGVITFFISILITAQSNEIRFLDIQNPQGHTILSSKSVGDFNIKIEKNNDIKKRVFDRINQSNLHVYNYTDKSYESVKLTIDLSRPGNEIDIISTNFSTPSGNNIGAKVISDITDSYNHRQITYEIDTANKGVESVFTASFYYQGKNNLKTFGTINDPGLRSRPHNYENSDMRSTFEKNKDNLILLGFIITSILIYILFIKYMKDELTKTIRQSVPELNNIIKELINDKCTHKETEEVYRRLEEFKFENSNFFTRNILFFKRPTKSNFNKFLNKNNKSE